MRRPNYNNVPAARLLLKNGAAIDKPDSEGQTALWIAKSQEMAALLVHHGASVVDHFSEQIIDLLGWRIEWFVDIVSVYSETNNGYDKTGTGTAFLLDTYDTRGSMVCRLDTMTPVHVATILKTNVNLTQEFGPGRSPMHVAITNRASSTFVLNSDLAFEGTTPFPWHLVFWTDLAFLGSMFRHF